MAFGYTIIAEFLFFSIGGYFLDQKLNTGYIWTLIGIGLAFVMIGYEIWKISKKL
jgi:hypothetical protein